MWNPMVHIVAAVLSLWFGDGNISQQLQRILTMFLTTILSIFCFRYVFKSLKHKKDKLPPLPPGPCGLPIVGYLPFLRSQIHTQFAELAKTYGPIFKIRLGSKLYVIITSPTLIEQVTSEHDITFANRNPTIAAKILSENCNDILFASYNQTWTTLRKVFVSKIMSKSILDTCYDLRRREVRHAVKYVHEHRGKEIDMSEFSFLILLNAAMNLLWGNTFEDEEGEKLSAEFKEVVEKLVKIIARANVSDFFPSLAKFDLQGIEKETKKLCLEMDKFFTAQIDKHKKLEQAAEGVRLESTDFAEIKASKGFLQYLLQLRESGEVITLTQIKAMLRDIIGAATDTLSTAIEWVMTELILNPEMMKRVQNEISDVVGFNDIVEEDHVLKLPYLDAVVKETLRLHPPGALTFPRRPSSATVIGGYTIPEGTSVFINIWAVHRDPTLWHNPLEFRPERFLSPTTVNGVNGGMASNFDAQNASAADVEIWRKRNYQYLPFSNGRRMCAGIALAERMVKHMIASFVHSFDWELPKGVEKVDMNDTDGVVVRKRVPLVALATPRLPNSDLYL